MTAGVLQRGMRTESLVRALGWACTAIVVMAIWDTLDHTLSRGLPAGIVLQGVVYGSLYALVAIGIVLVYRANRVVNFAQAEFGSVAAVLAIELRVHYHLEYFTAIIIGFIVALITGALINVLVINRFRKASRLILSVVTIGLAQILT